MKEVLKALVFVALVNGGYYFVAKFYLEGFSWIHGQEFYFSHVLGYSYLLTLPVILVFLISRESSDGLKFATQLSVFLCIVLTNQFVFASFYEEASCIQTPSSPPRITQAPDDLLYFSFLTFGTLGYGDFTPVGSCRPVSATQSIFGVMAIAVLLGLLSRQFKEETKKEK